MLAFSCEIDNYDPPDATIQGAFFDHHGQPLQVEQGAEFIRMREISWAKGDEDIFIGNRRLRLWQDGTYVHSKQFSGDYLMLPSNGNFFPYWDADDPERDGDDAGDLVKIANVVTKDFHVTPYLSIEWVQKPRVVDGNYIECVARFTRNQKAGYEMPDVQFANMQVSRTKFPNRANISELVPSQLTLTNDMEGTEITFRTRTPVKWTGISYFVRITMNCRASGTINYPGLGAWNCSTVEEIFVP